MNDNEICAAFQPLWDDIRPENEFDVRKPLLAHYTSVVVLEQMLKNGELWFSNPLFMNDIDEVRFGLSQGVPLVLQSPEIRRACGTVERGNLFSEAFEQCYRIFMTDHLVDTYVFCFSEHEPSDREGRLSMWRGYGSQGNGVAVVFDSSKIPKVDPSAFALAQVHYASREDRVAWIRQKISTFAEILGSVFVPNDKLVAAARELFERIVIFALFTKHSAFLEEKEWRAVYVRSRDVLRQLDSMFSYYVSPRGVEPKLKLKIAGAPGAGDLSLASAVDRIILGPSASSPLALAAVRRIFEQCGCADLAQKLHASGIPFRPR